ncbi:gamma-glutamyl-gamma-aminobutyrate hydrolase family protein [Capillimicrobium parvum]|uniref:Glutamine amidotransferase n=1 Tax=Capillimicrobium parvum TaxID=2884022 RepID=A0A9E7C2H1_9ACTN|nr:gamma-glutamyl-gamma-aminobutyrate hydrolase family protein [Capillimicrobium parvum]UGS37438.1 Putative glutamine amidotransferase [Capillimicrobium parvum]
MTEPLVGISTSELRTPPHVEPLAESDPVRRELALGLDYPRAVDAAGAIPVVIPPMAAGDLNSLVGRLDGLLLSGGPDLHPSLYGAEPHAFLGPTEPPLDAFELELLRRADQAQLPLLAICRGQQALNVGRGGTLYQHLPEDVGGEIEHRQRQPGRVATHTVRIEPDSAVADALGATDIEVNSFHHQAIRDLGRGLRAVAWARDGVIEAIEATDRRFAIGVQWHAESLVARDDHQRLFRRFVDAAAQTRAGGARAAA